GDISFGDTPRADVAEELTYACELCGIPVSLLWPTHVTTPKWTLLPGIAFGLGTTFGGAVYHSFEISKGHTGNMFLEKCRQVLAAPHSGGGSPSLSNGTPPCAADQNPWVPQQASFHEQWYAESELALLAAAAQFSRPLQGAVIEIGCWEG